MAQSIEEVLKELGEVKTGFNDLALKTKQLMEQQALEIKGHGSTSDKLGNRMDEMNTQWKAAETLMESLKAQVVDFVAKQGREAAGALNGLPGGLTGLATLGMAFVSSDEYKSMIAERRYASKKFEVLGGIRHTGKGLFVDGRLVTKSVEETSAELGALVETFRYDQVIQEPLRPPRVADMLTRINVTSSSIEYVVETLTLAIYSVLSVQANAAQKDLVVGTDPDGRSLTRGWMAGQTITLSIGETNEEEHVIDSIAHATGTITVVDNLANIHVVGRSLSANEYEATPEAEIKPCGHVEYDTVVGAIKTLATLIPLSKQMMMDSTAVMGLLGSRLEAMIELDEEFQILQGDGTSNQYLGILNHPDIQTYLWSMGLTGDSQLDAVRRSFTQVFLAFYPVDSVMFHPSNWEQIETLKGSDGHYIFNQAQVSPGVTTIWRATVIETAAMVLNQWLAGAFRLGAILWDRQQASLDVSEEHKDYFGRNMVAIRVEQRGDMSVVRPTSFVLGTFDNEPV